jgi:hypothetical protein
METSGDKENHAHQDSAETAENPENGTLTAPLILTVPACGFVVALSLEWIDGVALAGHNQKMSRY